MLYIQESAKYALQQSIYELALNGGVAEIEFDQENEDISAYECGKFDGAYVWYEIKKEGRDYKKKECFDGNYLITYLEYYFNKRLNFYLDNFNTNFPKNNYHYLKKHFQQTKN